MHDDARGPDPGNVGGPSEASGVSRLELATVALHDSHACGNFICARSARVEGFLKRDRHRLAGSRLANVFVLEDRKNPLKILGYYCLSAGQIERDLVSNKLRKDLPRDIAPMAMLGFMGRDDSAPKGIGDILIADAAIRVSRQDIAVWGIMLHAENDELMKWYLTRGFKTTPENKVSERNHRLMYAPLSALLPAETKPS